MSARARTALLAAVAALGAAAPAPAYTLEPRPGGGLEVSEGAGRSLALTVVHTGAELTLTPAADVITGGLAGCATAGAATTCGAASGFATGVAVSASQLTLRLTDVRTGALQVTGGGETDVVRATGLSVSGAVTLATGAGDDVVELAGAAGSVGETPADGADRYVLDLPGLTGAFATGDGADVVLARRTALAVDGGPGDDVLESGGALAGGDGDDVLRPAAATGTADGGPGARDRVSYTAVPDAGGAPPALRLRLSGAGEVSVGAGGVTVVGVEELEGGRGPDEVIGRPGVPDRLLGGPGADRLRGAGGPDHLDGGTGPDTASYEDVAAPVTVDLATGGGGPAGPRDELVSIDGVVGGAGDDELRGDDAANRLEGGPGRDVLDGRGGDDELRAGAGAAVLIGGDGFDLLEADLGAAFADVLDGGDGDDTLRAGPGDDRLQGGRGTDVIDGGLGQDSASWAERLAFEPVNVTLTGAVDDGAQGEADVLAEIEGAVGGAGDDRLVGTDGENRLDGGAGADTVLGLRGADVLLGGAGDDAVDAFDLVADVVDCGEGGGDSADLDALDAVSGCEGAARISVDDGDQDGDQVRAPLDCDDRNPEIRPGAVDVPGNAVDEDCSGADAAFPRVLSPVRTSFDNKRKGTRVVRMTVTDLPAGARVRLTCRRSNGGRKGCPFRTKTVTPARGRTSVRLQPFFGRRRLRGGLKLEVRIIVPDAIGRYVSITTRPRGRSPLTPEPGCLRPGTARVVRC